MFYQTQIESQTAQKSASCLWPLGHAHVSCQSGQIANSTKGQFKGVQMPSGQHVDLWGG